MRNLVEGLRNFQKNVFPKKQGLFTKLANGQSPGAMFITCSDSRIVPDLITQTEPGDLFVLRNAGNIVPPFNGTVERGGEAATIEYAVRVLKIGHLIVCGHTQCGAIAGLMNPDSLSELPGVSAWLTHVTKIRDEVREKYGDRSPEEQLLTAIQQNVRMQLDHLLSYSVVSSAVEQGTLTLHGWVYDIGAGEITAYHPAQDTFVSLLEAEVDSLV